MSRNGKVDMRRSERTVKKIAVATNLRNREYNHTRQLARFLSEPRHRRQSLAALSTNPNPKPNPKGVPPSGG